MDNRSRLEEVAEYYQNNLGLAYYFAKKYSVKYFESMEDIKEEALYGLAKAAINFKPGKNTLFSTYASVCIQNEIKMFLRKKKHEKQYIPYSLEEPIKFEEREVELINKLQDNSRPLITEVIEQKEEIVLILNNVVNRFSFRNMLVLLYTMGGIHQKNIADILGISQSYVSRLTYKCIKQLKEILKISLSNYPRAKVSCSDDVYQMTISISPGDEIEKIREALLEEKLKSKLCKRENHIEIQIFFLLEEEDFISLANLFGKLEGFLSEQEEDIIFPK